MHRHSVSIHAPARGATDAIQRGNWPLTCFNPRPRAGGDYTGWLHMASVARVSIHAPARGATHADCQVDCERLDVSIHAPARGATDVQCSIPPSQDMFQSTPPRGGRLAAMLPGVDGDQCFNPRPRAGGDRLRLDARPVLVMFQSTPPRGGRPSDGSAGADHGCFNPRPRAGGDGELSETLRATADVSIHAPARGATTGDAGVLRPREVSIHAPARGATRSAT